MTTSDYLGPDSTCEEFQSHIEDWMDPHLEMNEDNEYWLESHWEGGCMECNAALSEALQKLPLPEGTEILVHSWEEIMEMGKALGLSDEPRED